MSQTPAKLVLTKARSLIADESHWLQHDWKEEFEGVTRRCAYQAVEDAAASLGLDDTRALNTLSCLLGDDGECARELIPDFNDTSTHEDVLALFDLALEDA